MEGWHCDLVRNMAHGSSRRQGARVSSTTGLSRPGGARGGGRRACASSTERAAAPLLHAANTANLKLLRLEASRGKTRRHPQGEPMRHPCTRTTAPHLGLHGVAQAPNARNGQRGAGQSSGRAARRRGSSNGWAPLILWNWGCIFVCDGWEWVPGGEREPSSPDRQGCSARPAWGWSAPTLRSWPDLPARSPACARGKSFEVDLPAAGRRGAPAGLRATHALQPSPCASAPGLTLRLGWHPHPNQGRQCLQRNIRIKSHTMHSLANQDSVADGC